MTKLLAAAACLGMTVLQATNAELPVTAQVSIGEMTATVAADGDCNQVDVQRCQLKHSVLRSNKVDCGDFKKDLTALAQCVTNVGCKSILEGIVGTAAGRAYCTVVDTENKEICDFCADFEELVPTLTAGDEAGFEEWKECDPAAFGQCSGKKVDAANTGADATCEDLKEIVSIPLSCARENKCPEDQIKANQVDTLCKASEELSDCDLSCGDLSPANPLKVGVVAGAVAGVAMCNSV